MCHGTCLVAALLLGLFVTSLQEELHNATEYNYEDDYYDGPAPLMDLHKNDATYVESKTAKETHNDYTTEPTKIHKVHDKEDRTTKRKLANYEVTELVIDVPDVSTKRPPIFKNFTITRPLNLAGVANKSDSVNTNTKDDGDEIVNKIFVSDSPAKNLNSGRTFKPDKETKDRHRAFHENNDKKIFFDHFHHTDNFYEEQDEGDEDEIDDIDLNSEHKVKGFHDYFHTSGDYENVQHRHRDDINDSVHKLVNNPLFFLSKLHKKGLDFAKKLHTAISRHKFHDNEYEYY